MQHEQHIYYYWSIIYYIECSDREKNEFGYTELIPRDVLSVICFAVLHVATSFSDITRPLFSQQNYVPPALPLTH